MRLEEAARALLSQYDDLASRPYLRDSMEALRASLPTGDAGEPVAWIDPRELSVLKNFNVNADLYRQPTERATLALYAATPSKGADALDARPKEPKQYPGSIPTGAEDIVQTIKLALERGYTPAEILDENSPIRDRITSYRLMSIPGVPE